MILQKSLRRTKCSPKYRWVMIVLCDGHKSYSDVQKQLTMPYHTIHIHIHIHIPYVIPNVRYKHVKKNFTQYHTIRTLEFLIMTFLTQRN